MSQYKLSISYEGTEPPNCAIILSHCCRS